MVKLLSILASVLLLGAAVATPASAEMTVCRISYLIKGWSFVYKNYKGTGTVRCENGQSATVAIQTHGGGPSIGKSEVKGKGRFSSVRTLGEVYGTYIEADAHAGATKSVDARVLTKGEVSVSLSGTGRGFDLGFAFGAFTIEPR